MRESSLEEAIKSIFSSEMKNVFTALPCIVVTVHNNLADQRVDVKPLISKRFKDGTQEEHPPILQIPLMFPASKTSAFTFPVSVGDTVLCVFSQRGTDAFRTGTGSPAIPLDYRMFDKRDAIAIPGLFPFANAINTPGKRTNAHSTADAVIVHNIGADTEVELRMLPDGSMVINSPTSVTINTPEAVVNSDTATINAPDTAINATTTTITSPTISMVGNVTVTGNFTVASGFVSQYYGNVTFTGGSITHNDIPIGSSHTHDVPNIQAGASTATSQGPNT